MLWSGGAGIWHSYPATANDAPSPDGPSTCEAARHVRTGERSGRTARLAHGPDESVEVDEIVRVTETLVLATLRACGTLE
jgi:acetylornithine deacetylase/succinyl-diaminopimelate desuccinylase-like protein